MPQWLRSVLLLWLVVSPAFAQPRLLFDINATVNGGDSSPRGFVSLDGVAYFWTTGSEDAPELWRSTGTPASTTRIATCPDCGGFVPENVFASGETGQVYARLADDTFRLAALDAASEELAEVFSSTQAAIDWKSFVDLPGRGLTLFLVTSPWAGPELWATDGSRAGTRPISRVVDAAEPSAVPVLVFRSHAYFVADDGTRGPTLWRADGSPAGTRPVVDLVPGRRDHPAPRLLAVGPSGLLLAGWTRERGEEPWFSDGTARGTRPLADLVPGRGGSDVRRALAAGSRFFFVATSGRSGQELHVFDGRRVRTLSRFAHPRPLLDERGSGPFATARVFGERLFFAAFETASGVEPWVSDGSSGGTRLLGDLFPGPGSSLHLFEPSDLGGGRWLFLAAPPNLGFEPFVTDGTPAGTRLLRDLCRGDCSSHASLLGGVDGVSLLGSDGPDGSFHLWRTDGTAGGTRRVFIGGRRTSGSLALPDRLLLGLDDGISGEELWAWSPPATLEAVGDLRPGTGDSLVCGFASTADEVFFLADDGVHGVELWSSRGTAGTTRLVAEAEPGPGPRTAFPFAQLSAIDLGPRSLVDVSTSEPVAWNGLWSTDGTPEGTLRLAAGGPILQLGNRGYFGVFDEATGQSHLGSTDGTPGGTVQIAADVPGPVRPGAVVGDRLVFVALRDFPFANPPQRSQFEIWSTDGTTAGTRQLAIATVGPFLSATIVRVGDRVYFPRIEGAVMRLWSTDGTPAGTGPVHDADLPLNRVWLYDFGGRVLLSGGLQISLFDFVPAESSWIFDPDTGELTEVDGLVALGGQVFGDELYFRPVRSEELAQSQLWKTDGTLVGTSPVRTADDRPVLGATVLEVVGDRLVSFAANAGLWSTDGTPEGTRELYLGRSPCDRFGVAGGEVVFVRDTGETGREPWIVDP